MMILRFRSLWFSTTAVDKYLTPFTLQVNNSPIIPTLKVKSHKLLLKNWWSEPPFELEGQMLVPVFNFHTNQYTEQSVQLPTDIFNQPIRRDLIHRLYDYRRNLNKFTTKVTRNRGMTAGSGAKVRPQKKSGTARMGEKRAPHLKKGGKAHGAKAKVYSFPLNTKIKIKALCALFSAKMSEGKIKVVDTESIDEPKTKILNKIIDNHTNDERTNFCIITHRDVSTNFSLAQRNLKRVIWHDSYTLDVKSLLIADKIIFTMKGLEELIQSIRKTTYIAYRQPYMPKIQEPTEEKAVQEETWNPEKPYEFKFKILAEYLDLYEQVKLETPELLERQFKKIRQIS